MKERTILKNIKNLIVGDPISRPGADNSIREFVESGDDFTISRISESAVVTDSAEKTIFETISLSGPPASRDFGNYIYITSISKHSNFRWTIFAINKHTATRVILTAFSVDFDG